MNERVTSNKIRRINHKRNVKTITTKETSAHQNLEIKLHILDNLTYRENFTYYKTSYNLAKKYNFYNF